MATKAIPPAKFGSPAHKKKISDSLKQYHKTKGGSPTRATAPKPAAKPSNKHKRIQDQISQLNTKIKGLDKSVGKSVRDSLNRQLSRLNKMLANTP